MASNASNRSLLKMNQLKELSKKEMLTQQMHRNREIAPFVLNLVTKAAKRVLP